MENNSRKKKYIIVLAVLVLLLVLMMVGIMLSIHHNHGKSHTLNSKKSEPNVPKQLLPPNSGNMQQQQQQQQQSDSKLRHRTEFKKMRIIKYDVVVSPRGDGNFTTVSEAISFAPLFNSAKFYVRVRYGVYNEVVVVPANRTNIVLIGDGANVTKITANRHQPEYSTSGSATFTIFGDGFMAQDMTFENNAGGKSGQAVALLCKANHTVFYKCRFLGYQDTLYAKQGTQYYRDCDIYGTVDFIFGFAAAVFQKCNLYARVLGSYQEITYTAQGRQSLLDKGSGFIMQGCNFTIDPKLDRSIINTRKIKKGYTVSGFLGRPWYPYSTVMVMESFLDKTISSSGWMAWDGRENNVDYLEFRNWGPGSNTSKRVRWPGYKALDDAIDAMPYTPSHFIQGDQWIPQTGVPYEGDFMFKSSLYSTKQ